MRIDASQSLESLRRAHRAISLATILTVALVALPGCWQAAPETPSSAKPKDTNSEGEGRGVQQASTPEGSPRAAVAAVTQTPGQVLYGRHCAACHGAQGDGKGLASAYLFPKPRDFQAGRFRLVSTSNKVPSRDDLQNVLLRGMPGSSMPPWKHLSQAQRDALVDEVMRLRREGARRQFIQYLKEQEELTDEEIASDDVQEELHTYVEEFTTPGESTKVPEFSTSDSEALKRGKAIYAVSGCLQCHGKEGKGDGVQKMVDEEKYPTAPRDFTIGIFKGGADPASIYRRIAYGMPGTPMPSSKQMTPEQMMDLTHYVRSMSTEAQRQAAVLNREDIVVKAVGKAPTEPDDASWSDVAAVALRMAPLWWRNDADPGLRVQALHDGKTVAVRISWKDDTPNWHAARSEAFEDAVAMELYRGDEEPFLGMGDPRAPIDVWFWDADRQQVDDVEDEYPRVVVDVYPFSEKEADTPEYRRPGTQLANQPKVSLPALASGNQIAPGHAATGGSSLSGSGPGSSTFRIPKSQIVSGRGVWQEGRWHVVLARSMTTKTAEDGISLEPSKKTSVAFAVWDGSVQDRDGKKLITIWQNFVLEQ